MSNDHRLIADWRRCDLESPPYLFPGDKEHLDDSRHVVVHTTFEQYLNSEEFGGADKILHTGLLPLPYIGNLEKATIFVLMLNPGLSHGDYFAEYHCPEFRKAHVRNLKQDIRADDPFLFLDPRFAWHPGFVYWQRKFNGIIATLARKEFRDSYKDAIREFSRKVACLQLVPYHSRSFGAGDLRRRLPSVEGMREYVREVVVPKAEDGSAVVVVTRSHADWGPMANKQNIVVYEKSESRSAHLTPGSRGGEAIAKHLGIGEQANGN